MGQGKGYWYNPSNNIGVEINRHEQDIKLPKVQKKLDMHPAAIEEVNALPNSAENEDKIKILTVESGLIRIRDWQNFTTVQLSARKRRLEDMLGRIADLIQAFKDKSNEYHTLDKDTQGLAKLLATSWNLKLDNLLTKSTESIDPDGFLKSYVDEGFLEEDNWKDTDGRGVRDIPMNEGMCVWARSCLEKRGFYKDLEISSLFEDQVFLKESKTYGIIKEAQRSQSRAWVHMVNPGVFGVITAYRGEYQEKTDKHGRRNKQRQAELIDRMKTLGFGVFKLYGAWDEGGGVGREESLLWYPLKDKWEDMNEAGKDLLRLTKDWCNEFDQDGAIYRDIPDPEAPIMLWRHKETDYKTGKVTIINDSIKAGKGFRLKDDISGNKGQMYINRLKKDLGDAWSELAKGPKDRNFVFEDVTEDDDDSQ